jgi:RNA polymerase sigma-70 factor, ECF subfamily
MFNLKYQTMESKKLDYSNLTLEDFPQIFAVHKAEVVAFIRQKVKSTENVEDITMLTFEKVYQHLLSYNPNLKNGVKFSTWVLFIAKNKIIDYFRGEGMKAQRFVSVDNLTDKNGDSANIGEFFLGYENTSAPIENKELSADIEKAFESLKPNYRCVAEMYLRQDMTYEKIAEILDIPMGTVKATLLRAKQMLQAELTKQYKLMYA